MSAFPDTLPAASRPELLKWLAIGTMIVDHGGLVIWTQLHPWTFVVGRLAWPLFALLVAVRLADKPARGLGYLSRLLLWAVVAQPAYQAIAGMPRANVLVTLAVGVALTLAILHWPLHPGAVALSVVGLAASPFIDFGPPGVLLVPVLALLARWRPWAAVWACGPLAFASQVVLAPDFAWLLLGALAASPVAALLLDPGWDPPRLPRWTFYAVYPGHLWILWGWLVWMI